MGDMTMRPMTRIIDESGQVIGHQENDLIRIYDDYLRCRENHRSRVVRGKIKIMLPGFIPTNAATHSFETSQSQKSRPH
jgi:hypothetical protein